MYPKEIKENIWFEYHDQSECLAMFYNGRYQLNFAIKVPLGENREAFLDVLNEYLAKGIEEFMAYAEEHAKHK
jgi:hypothetical protein